VIIVEIAAAVLAVGAICLLVVAVVRAERF
jgi:hypothetical protein